MSDEGNKWYLNEGFAETNLLDTGGGNYDLELDVVDAGVLQEGLQSLLMGMSNEVHIFINQSGDGSCRLLTVKLKQEEDDPIDLPPAGGTSSTTH